VIWEGRGFSFDCSARTHIMGVLNVTPDSFSDGGLFFDLDKAVQAGLEMIENGADMIDVGGESTRPGSDPVELQEEIDRVCPVIEKLAAVTEKPISIDTYKALVAKSACEAGANIVNDISGLSFDGEMAKVVGESGAGLVLMHIKGQPKTMQENPIYENLFSEVILQLTDAIDKAQQAGIPRNRIAIDPGIGFGKTVSHNLALMANLKRLAILRRPLLLGVSRKAFIGVVSGAPVGDRLPGSIAAAMVCAINGARILRVHDVPETVQAAKVTDAILAAAALK
jgi:dihydropteroate synthase